MNEFRLRGLSMRRVALCTALAMMAFAANSLLCRLALKHTQIDPASFTTLRLMAGAMALWLIVRITPGNATGRGNWLSAFALVVYAAGFSFAYVSLPAAIGALLLFSAVQATMITYGMWTGEYLQKWQLIGFGVALTGLVGLLLPGLSAPPWFGSVLMVSAGVAWAVYCLRGKLGGAPMRITAGNFLRAAPIALAVSLLMYDSASIDQAGIWYAIASGALSSGLGYAIWYAALPGLSPTQAASVQLSVPVLTALGGVAWLDEQLSLRLILASISILGGIALVILCGKKAD